MDLSKKMKIFLSLIRSSRMCIPALFGHRFRSDPDSVPELAGQDSGGIRTAIRDGPDRVPVYPDSFWHRPEWGGGKGSSTDPLGGGDAKC